MYVCVFVNMYVCMHVYKYENKKCTLCNNNAAGDEIHYLIISTIFT